MRETKLNLIFISENFPPETNAAATRVYERANYWKDWGHSTYFLTSFPNRFLGKKHPGYSDRLFRKDDFKGLEVLRVKTFIPKYPGLLGRLVHQITFMFSSLIAGILLNKADIMVVTTPQFFCSISGLIISRIKRIPLVLEVADIWSDSIKGTYVRSGLVNKFARMLEIFVYKRSDMIITLTHGFKRDIIDRGIDQHKIRVVRNGFEINNAVHGPIFESNELPFVRKGRKIIGYVGSLGAAQDFSNIVRAAAIVEERSNENILFVFVGDGDEKINIVKLVREMKVTNIVFIGSQSRDKVPIYMKVFDYGLIPLANDKVFKNTVPSKLFEMMSFGLPFILVAPRGEASEIVMRYDIGRWVDAGSPEILSDAIIELTTDETQRKIYSKNSKSTSKLFTREKQAREYVDILLTLQKERGASVERSEL